MRALLLAGLLLAPARALAGPDGGEPAAEEPDDGGPSHELEVGFRGSRGREASTSDFDWGPTVSYSWLTARARRARVKSEFELSYNDAMTDYQTRTSSLATRVRAFEFRYAKLHLMEAFGFDLKKRLGLIPYVSGGVQYVDSRQDSREFDEETEAYVSNTTRERYWSPTFGFGVEVPLNKKVTLALDYGSNAESGDRRVARATLELKVAVFGGEE